MLPLLSGRADFNPRSPRGERLAGVGRVMSPGLFQSTLPAWGATPCRRSSRTTSTNFNPRSPRGERRRSAMSMRGRWNFNPRSPRGERPSALEYLGADLDISIHAPRVGSDEPCSSDAISIGDFNPRSPRGERLRRARPFLRILNFNPRSPRGERPAQPRLLCRGRQISIHAPRVGSDGARGKGAGAQEISIHAPRVGSD